MTDGFVLDASAVVEYLRGTDVGLRVAATIDVPGTGLHLPHLCGVEVASAFRGLVAGRVTTPERAAAALVDLADLPATRYPVEPLLTRIWALRTNLTASDANYVALSEALDATLVTSDRKLAPTYRRYADVVLVR